MSNGNIMIVEDEFVLQHQVKLILEGFDYQVIATASEAEEAIEKAGTTKPDLILMDINLSGDLDGIYAATEIKKKMGIPVIFISAFSDDAKIERAKLSTPFGYLVKPVKANELKITIEMALYAAKLEAERKLTEAKLIESEKKYRRVFENNLSLYYETSLDGTLLEISPSVEGYLSYTRKELIGTSILSLYADPSRRYDLVEKLLSEGEIHNEELQIKDKSGAVLSALLSAKYIPEESKFVGSMLDLTVRKAAEIKLAESEALFRATVNAMNEGMIIRDMNAQPVFINPKMLELTGYDETSMLEMNFEDLYTEESLPKVLEGFSETLETGRPGVYEVQMNRKGGGTIDILLSGSRLKVGDDSKKTVAIFTDISNIKRLEKEREDIIAQLQEALDSIKTLSGLVPICASCKKIRDDTGYWNQIEHYIEKHSDAQFSHGVCPDCADQIYGKHEWYQKGKSKGKLD